MMRRARLICSTVAASILTGCATAPHLSEAEFLRTRRQAANVEVCWAVENYKAGSDAYRMALEEFNSRTLTLAACNELRSVNGYSSKQPARSGPSDGSNGVEALGAVLAAVAVGALVVAGAKGGAFSNSPNSSKVDTDWAWDQFYDENYRLVWACRGMQTGEFADPQRCAYKPKVDSTWPGLTLKR